MSYPETKRIRPRKHPVLSTKPVSVREIAEDSSVPWEPIVLAEGGERPNPCKEKIYALLCLSENREPQLCEAGTGNMALLKEICGWGNKIFRFQCSWKAVCPGSGQGSYLKWPIEQCFEECKSILGIVDYECRSYQGWNCHMLFVMIAHLFTLYILEILKKMIPLTMPMVVKLMYGIITYTVTNMKAVVTHTGNLTVFLFV